jgi:hypothetical protein
MRRLLGAPALPLLYSLYYTVQYFLPFRSKKKCPHLLLFIFIYLNKRSCGVIDTACIFYFFPYHRCFAYDFRFRSSPKVCLCMHSNICANSNLYSGAQDGCFDKKKKRGSKISWHCLVFFHQRIPPGPLIHGLKPFWILLRILRDMIDFRTQKSCMRCQWHRMHENLLLDSPFKFKYFLVVGKDNSGT